MARSPGFGSKATNSKRPVQTRFRCASTYRLKLARYFKSLTHYTKGTQSPRTNPWLLPLVSIRFQDLFHSPRRGAFHLSLTVLVHYRSSEVFSLGGWSPQLPTGFHVSRSTHVQSPSHHIVADGTLTRFGRPFQQR